VRRELGGILDGSDEELRGVLRSAATGERQDER
jgi:hypothetical protein